MAATFINDYVQLIVINLQGTKLTVSGVVSLGTCPWPIRLFRRGGIRTIDRLFEDWRLVAVRVRNLVQQSRFRKFGLRLQRLGRRVNRAADGDVVVVFGVGNVVQRLVFRMFRRRRFWRRVGSGFSFDCGGFSRARSRCSCFFAFLVDKVRASICRSQVPHSIKRWVKSHQ